MPTECLEEFEESKESNGSKSTSARKLAAHTDQSSLQIMSMSQNWNLQQMVDLWHGYVLRHSRGPFWCQVAGRDSGTAWLPWNCFSLEIQVLTEREVQRIHKIAISHRKTPWPLLKMSASNIESGEPSHKSVTRSSCRKVSKSPKSWKNGAETDGSTLQDLFQHKTNSKRNAFKL